MFKIIENKLATEGIGQFDYIVLNEDHHQAGDHARDSWIVADVRDLYDDDSNSLEEYEKKIDLVWELMQQHNRVVICCVAGISRSNAIALGVLVKYFHMDFYEALELIREKVSRANISPGHIAQLKKLFKVTLP